MSSGNLSLPAETTLRESTDGTPCNRERCKYHLVDLASKSAHRRTAGRMPARYPRRGLSSPGTGCTALGATDFRLENRRDQQGVTTTHWRRRPPHRAAPETA